MWARPGSNRRHPRCKRGALPTELQAPCRHGRRGRRDRTAGVILSGRGARPGQVRPQPPAHPRPEGAAHSEPGADWTKNLPPGPEFHAGASSQSALPREQDSAHRALHTRGHLPAAAHRGETPSKGRHMIRRITEHRLRATAVVPAVALVAAGFAAVGSTASVSAAPASVPSAGTPAGDYYMNTVAPRAEAAFAKDVKLGKNKSTNQRKLDVLAKAQAYDEKHAGGNPVAARSSPRSRPSRSGRARAPAHQEKYKQATTHPEGQAADAAGRVQRPGQRRLHRRRWSPRRSSRTETCVPGTVQNGPKHNNIPNPATLPHKDNNSMWVPDFSSAALQQDALHQEGHHRAGPHRPDAARTARRASTSPATPCTTCTWRCPRARTRSTGRPARGSPCRTPRAGTAPTAATRTRPAPGSPAASQAMNGHPDNPPARAGCRPTRSTRWPRHDPNFPWADYDIEDQADARRRRQRLRARRRDRPPRAGARRSGQVRAAAAPRAPTPIWAHSSHGRRWLHHPGHQPEGCPTTSCSRRTPASASSPTSSATTWACRTSTTPSGNADSDVDFWDLMASGSHSGPIFQSMPTHMGIWDKWVLGWADPLTINPGRPRAEVKRRPDLAHPESAPRTASRSTCRTR